MEYLSIKLNQALKEDVISEKTTKTDSHTINWVKKEIISNCIYGVDLNDLAVDLTKVVLWLIILDKKKPLNFLDLRIKKGNSLIGAFLGELKWHLSNYKAL